MSQASDFWLDSIEKLKNSIDNDSNFLKRETVNEREREIELGTRRRKALKLHLQTSQRGDSWKEGGSIFVTHGENCEWSISIHTSQFSIHSWPMMMIRPRDRLGANVSMQLFLRIQSLTRQISGYPPWIRLRVLFFSGRKLDYGLFTSFELG